MNKPGEVCTQCGQVIPQPVGRLICSQCHLPILRKSGGWTHGPDGRPKHKNCERPAEKQDGPALLSLELS